MHSRSSLPSGRETSEVKTRRIKTRLLIILSGLVFFTFITVTLILGFSYLQFPSKPRGVSAIRSDGAPGIGFDLTPSYGTAAIRYDNGSFENVGRVGFSVRDVAGYPDTFEQMMKRLSQFKDFNDPYARYCHEDGLNFLPTRKSLWKRLRLLSGYPSTPDVGRLVDVIRLLKEKTESHLNHPITAVMVTAPVFVSLCTQDLDEAVAYLGLTQLEEAHELGLEDQPREVSTAYAGYGLGICKHYKDAERCEAEDELLPEMYTLFVLCTERVLMTYLIRMKTATIQYYRPGYHTYVVDWEAGSQQYLATPLSHEAYWELVKLRLMKLSLGAREIVHVDRVVLMGESAGSEELSRAVTEAMVRLQGDVPEIYQEDTLFVAARGAAGFAKVALEGGKQGHRRESGGQSGL